MGVVKVKAKRELQAFQFTGKNSHELRAFVGYWPVVFNIDEGDWLVKEAHGLSRAISTAEFAQKYEVVTCAEAAHE